MLDFVPKHKTLHQVLLDHKLAALGDAYVNFLFSLAESEKNVEPVGARVDNNILAAALRKAGLRDLLPSRTSRHQLADAAEALIIYAWIRKVTTIEEAVNVLKLSQDASEAFCSIIITAKEKLKL
jgi:hypothetical protein